LLDLAGSVDVLKFAQIGRYDPDLASLDQFVSIPYDLACKFSWDLDSEEFVH